MTKITPTVRMPRTTIEGVRKATARRAENLSINELQERVLEEQEKYMRISFDLIACKHRLHVYAQYYAAAKAAEGK